MATIGQVVYNLQDFHSSGGLISTDGNNLSTTVKSTDPGYVDKKINIFGEDKDIVDKFGKTPFTKLGIQAPPGTKVNLNSNKLIMIGRTGVYELDEDIKITKMWFERPKKYVVDSVKTQQSLTEGTDGFDTAEKHRDFRIDKLNVFYMRKIQEYMLGYNNIKSNTYSDPIINTAVINLRQLDINNPNPTIEEKEEDNDNAYWEEYFELRAQIPDLVFLDDSYKNSVSKDDEYWGHYTFAQDEYEKEYSKARAKYIAGVNGIYVLPNPDNPDADENYEDLYNVIIDFLY